MFPHLQPLPQERQLYQRWNGILQEKEILRTNHHRCCGGRSVHNHRCVRAQTDLQPQKHAAVFPVISRMARDILAIPGASVAVE